MAIGALCSVVTLCFFAFFGLANLYMKSKMNEAYYRAKFQHEWENEKDDRR